jgi:hypothetical protein
VTTAITFSELDQQIRSEAAHEGITLYFSVNQTGREPPYHSWEVVPDPAMSNDDKRKLIGISSRMRRDYHLVFDD